MSTVTRQQYEVRGTDEDPIRIEAVSRDDWAGLTDPCPECHGTEFDRVWYEGGHYGHEGEAVVLRTDYWDQKGEIYTACKECGVVLYKHPAYDLLRTLEGAEG